MKSRLYVIALLALLGFGVSTYLLTVHWGWWSAVCLGVGDCEAVNTSRFSELLGIPVALFGMGAYAALFGLSLAVERGIAVSASRLWALRALFVIAAIGVAFSIYLTYIELFVLYEVCPWCVLSAILVTTIAILSALELREGEPFETEPEVN